MVCVIALQCGCHRALTPFGVKKSIKVPIRAAITLIEITRVTGSGEAPPRTWDVRAAEHSNIVDVLSVAVFEPNPPAYTTYGEMTISSRNEPAFTYEIFLGEKRTVVFGDHSHYYRTDVPFNEFARFIDAQPLRVEAE